MSRLRHVKSVVQHTFVLDDGEHLAEQQTQPVVVAAKDWPDYPDEFQRTVKALEASLNGDGSDD